MKKDLNINPTPAPAPAPSPAPAAPQFTEEELLTKLEQRLRDQIKRKKPASSPLTSSQTQPVTPVDRQTPTQKEVPQTEGDKMFADMMAAGPGSASFLSGVEALPQKK